MMMDGKFMRDGVQIGEVVPSTDPKGHHAVGEYYVSLFPEYEGTVDFTEIEWHAEYLN